MQYFSIWIILCIVYHAYAFNNTNFSALWTNFTQDSQLSHASYSITILDNSTGNILFSFNKDIGLSPASTLKTVTGAAAFHYLGKDYRYETLLQYSGRISPSGFLNGYIYIVGSGDPSLGSWRWNETSGDLIMNRWLKLLASKGIKNCRGIVLDLSIWSGKTQTVPDGYIWEDLGNYFGTGSSALNWRENQFQIILSPGKAVGEPVSLVSVENLPPSVTLTNELITGEPGTGKVLNLYLPPDGTHGYLRGTLGVDSPQNFSIECAVPNSALFIADELRRRMNWSKAIPIKVLYQKETNGTNRTTIDIYQSPPLSEIIYWFEQVSSNMYGEVLVKTIAEKINSSFIDILPMYCGTEHNIEKTAVATIDGSGLSPENRITTSAIAHVLYNVRQRAPWFSLYERALPMINGIRMKSGYIMNALSYAGYVNNQVFSIITNNFNGKTDTMRQKIFQLLDTLK